MQIAFHIGANCTDDDRLLKSILKNADVLNDHDIKAPGPGKYRRLIRETIQNLNGADPALNTRQILLDAILDDEAPRRLVMANSNFICIPNRVFDHGVFYEQAVFKVRGLQQIFPEDKISLFMGIRNPATFLPVAFANSKADTFETFMQGMRLRDIRWSEVITRIQQTAPEATLTVWCNEDTPLIWADLIRTICGLSATTKITGGFDLLASIMAPEGMNRFLNYMRAHPPQTVQQKQRIISAFLDKYAIEDKIEDTVDVPGLDDAMLQELTQIYEQDVHLISQTPKVRFMAV